jgi:hypothetical protein
VSFAQCAARSLTVVSIRNNAPEASGVYGLCNNREWVFIGESANIRASLLQVLAESAGAVQSREPTGFTFEVCSALSRGARQNALIKQFRPACNGSHGRSRLQR